MTDTVFPGALDAFVDPASTSKCNGSNTTGPVVTHAHAHAWAFDAIAALETKVGIDSSADTNSIDYKLTAVIAGLATANGNITTLAGSVSTLSAGLTSADADITTLFSAVSAKLSNVHSGDLVATNAATANYAVTVDPGDTTKFKFAAIPAAGLSNVHSGDLVATNAATANYAVTVDPGDTTKFKFAAMSAGLSNVHSGDLVATNSATANYAVTVDPGDTTKFKFAAMSAGGSTVSEGAYGSRPAAGTAGNVYIANDAPIFSVDNGVSWDEYPFAWKAKSLDAEIAADSPTVFYKCSEQSGTTIADSGAGGLHLDMTISSGFTLARGALFPRETTLYPTAHAANVTVAGNPTGTSTPTGDWTISALFRMTTGNGGSIFSFHDASASASYYFLVEVVTGKLELQVTTNTYTPAVDANVLTGQLCLAHIVKDATAKTFTFYLNGVCYGSASFASDFGLTMATPTMKIANDRGGTGFDGFVGKCAYYHHVKLSATRIIAQAVAAGVFCSP